MILIIGLCLAMLAGMATPARAQKTVDNSPPQEVVGGMSNKFVRGVANVATGWVEFPKQIVITFKEDGVAKGIFVGPLKGIGMTIVRTVSGAGEMATFFHPFPGFYEPYFEPEYVWEKEP
jgi:putative exosortase-associated protein (TIGR04073 family)